MHPGSQIPHDDLTVLDQVGYVQGGVVDLRPSSPTSRWALTERMARSEGEGRPQTPELTQTWQLCNEVIPHSLNC